MTSDHLTHGWDSQLDADLRQLVRFAVLEDLDREFDWTTLALISQDATATASIVARQSGCMAGLVTGPLILQEMSCAAEWQSNVTDGCHVEPGEKLATLRGNARDMLAAERTILNILGRLSGIASVTSHFVARTGGTNAEIYDTRKTLPGWRRLEKYAVRRGGGKNHRFGLYDAILIKDNHLCHMAQTTVRDRFDPADAVRRVRAFLSAKSMARLVVEVEVDSIGQLESVLGERPDIVLLDNFSLDAQRTAVQMRNERASSVLLEASGGVNLDTVRSVAETGVDRISVGALTHSAPNFDVAMEWGQG